MPKRRRQLAAPRYLLERVRIVRKRLGRWGADALLISNPRDIRYLTGFAGEDSWLVVRKRASAAAVKRHLKKLSRENRKRVRLY